MHVKRAKILRVIDGDTIEVMMDMDCCLHLQTSLRFYGINCPEKNTMAGRAAQQFTYDAVRDLMLSPDSWVLVKTYKPDKYSNRFDTEVFIPTKSIQGLGWDLNDAAELMLNPDTTNLNQMILKAGHAVPYFGGARTNDVTTQSTQAPAAQVQTGIKGTILTGGATVPPKTDSAVPPVTGTGNIKDIHDGKDHGPGDHP